MPRKTLIFGNGVGMALDPVFFSLDHAIGEVWDGAESLNDDTKDLIRACLPNDAIDRPHGEADLDTLQLALSACEFLTRIGQARIHWLSEEGQRFPDAVRKFIYHTALEFHGHPAGLPATFTDPLADFVAQTRSHVATLNYDNLLYQPLIEREVLRGYYGALVDGFYNTGFSPENLKRLYGNKFGYYLHLHGSPLFVDRAERTYKLPQAALGLIDGTVSSHIVLTHFRHKPTVIAASEVLSTYWSLLPEAIAESEEVMLIGCSGEDAHLNSLLRASSEVPIQIVEWTGAGDLDDRVDFWESTLDSDFNLIQLDSILTFTGWNDPWED